MCQNCYRESSFLEKHKLTGQRPCKLDRDLPPPASYLQIENLLKLFLAAKSTRAYISSICRTGKGKALRNPRREGGKSIGVEKGLKIHKDLY